MVAKLRSTGPQLIPIDMMSATRSNTGTVHERSLSSHIDDDDDDDDDGDGGPGIRKRVWVTEVIGANS